MDKSFVSHFLLCCLLQLASSSPATRKESVIVAEHGKDVSLSLKIPDSLTNPVFFVSLKSADNIVFVVTTTPHSRTIVRPSYADRIKVVNDLGHGLIKFTLKNVSHQDAGRFLCSKGSRAADVADGCGGLLVIVDAPREASINPADGSPIIGSTVTLHCTARSTTSPRDHKLPMKFQWFEARINQGQNGALDWSPVESGTKEISQGVDYFDDHENDEVLDAGSGEVDEELVMGSSSPLNNVLEIDSIDRKDDGRVFACSASEGFDLWSNKSGPFVLRPEWKPESSDVTFDPEVSYVTLTVGDPMNIRCSANCRPECSVKWQKVRSDDRVQTVSTSSKLSMTRAGRQQEGLYRCVASNHHGQAFRSVTLNIVDRPVPWYTQPGPVITVVAVVTLMLAVCMSVLAYAVIKCRQRSSPFMLPRRKKTSDAVPLSTAAERPAMVSYL